MRLDLLRADVMRFAELCRESLSRGETIVVTGHDMPDCDSIISAVMLSRLLSGLGIEATAKFGSEPDGVTRGLCEELGVIDGVEFDGFEEDESLVLVDHHETFYNNRVIGCVDHHTTPPEPHYEFNLIQRASSCGRVIYDMACACDKASDWMEKMAIYSVYLDTQSTRAPKFEKSDLPWLKDGIRRLSLDENDLVRKGFCLNSLDERADVLAMYAYKKYEFNGKTAASTCVQIDPSEGGWRVKIDEMIIFLRKRMGETGESMWALVVNMPTEMRSNIYFLRGDNIEIVALDRLASRSKDVIPVVIAI